MTRTGTAESPKPRLDLLELLAKRLETEEKIPFYYGSFVGADWKGAEDLSCGTTACAAGIATTMPEFRELGLRLHRSSHYKQDVYPAVGCYTGIIAMAKVLSLSDDEASYLFTPSQFLHSHNCALPMSPGACGTATGVAAHIRQFIAWRLTQS